MIVGLSKEEFYARATGPYWEQTRDARWEYSSTAIGWVEKQRAERVLELGCAGLPLFHGSDSMDVAAETQPTFLRDATETPWPVADKAYDVFVALQVFEHLLGKQQAVFAEVMRTSRQAILSFPFKWKDTSQLDHNDIDERVIAHWTLGVPSRATHIVSRNRKRMRIIMHWVFE